MSTGFTDKLYWRFGDDDKIHCFKRTRYDGEKKAVFVSLCNRQEIRGPGNQDIRRPDPLLRCGICDGKEMDRRGVTESMPATC
jgi:hypothetical protein